MKSQLKHFSKSTLSVILSLCMLVSCMTVGLIATDAAQSAEERLGASDNSEALGYTSIAGRLYFDNSKTNWSNVYLYVGHGSYAKSYTMTNTGYHNIWYLDISDGFTDRTKIYFANHNDSPSGQNIGIDTQYGWNTTNTTRTALTTANNNDANSLFTPSSNSAGTLTRSYPRVVAGTLASNGWDDCTDIMTYSSSQWTKTYTNVASGDYVIAVVGFYNNWNPTYRWSAKGTGTGCTLSDAGDNDHNIKFTVSSLSDVTVTLTSSNKVNVTVTAKSTNYTGITAVAKGTTDGTSYSVDLGSIQSSTTVSSSTGLSVTAPDKTGYTFSKWVSSGSGTFDSDTSASTTFHPAANSEVATAQYKKNYTISKNSPTGGSVTLSNTSRVAGETFTVTISPDTGYVLSSLTVGGTDVTSSVSNNSYTGTASGTSDTINVVATFSEIPTTTIYVNKLLADGSFTHAHIWTTISGTNYNATGNWPGKQINSEWSLDSTHTDYYKLTFQKDGWTKFKIILSNNGSDQTTDSSEYNTGSTYYIDSATAGSAAELQDGAPEIKYTVTVDTDGNGTVGDAATATVQAGATGKVSLPEPKGNYGYVFDCWEKVSGGVTITDVTSSTSTVTATAAGTVKAKFKIDENMSLYIGGRFHIRESEGSSTWINSFKSGDWYSEGEGNIRFAHYSGSVYKVETYASPGELTTSISNKEPWFYVFDTGNNKKWTPASNVDFNDSTTEANLTSNDSGQNVRFNSTSTDTPVTLYFDVLTQKLWYEIPVYYTVTVSSVTGGTITSSLDRAKEGDEVILTISPDEHYQFSSVGVQQGTAAISLTDVDATHKKFTMPAGNVTVTPSFSPITYTGITYSAKGSKSADALTDLTDTAYTETLTAPVASGNNNPASGTYVNGIDISAPTLNGYTFYKWVATNGTFTEDSNVTESETASTTFYPTANDATLKALYRKNYTISVTNTTPALGSIAVDPVSNTVLAGDTFTLTATPQTNKKLIGLTLNGTSVISHVDHKVYTGTASGNESSLGFVATFGDIPSTIIYVNKKFADKDYGYKNHIYIWSTEGDKVKALESWPGTQFNSVGTADDSWKVDPIYPDYYRRVFWFDYEDFQVVLNNGNTGNMDQTGNSNKVETGKTYTLDEVDGNNCPVLVESVPVYNVAAEKGLAGGENDWDPTIAANEMTNNNGIFTLTKNNIPKSKHVYKGKDENEQDIYEDYYSYKVATGHNWNNGAHPDSNQNLHVLYNNSTVVFSFNPTTNTLTATVSGGSFDAQVPQTLQNGAAYISDNSSVSTDKSVTLSADKSYTEDNYSSGYTTKNVYVKVALNPHYEVTGWTDGNGTALTPATTPTVTPSETPDTVGDTVIAQFSVNQDITIVPTITRKHHNVYFTPSPTGGTVKVNGQDDSPQSVDEFTNYTITITPQKGYKLKTFEITSDSDSNTYTSNYNESEKRVEISKTVQMGYYDETVTVEFEKIGYTITGNVSPSGHGSIKYYEDNEGVINLNKELPSPPAATFEQYFWAVYVPNENDDYVLKNFEIAGDGGEIAPVLVEGSFDRQLNGARFKMGDSNATITANIMLQYAVTYYVDMHNTNMTNETVSIAVTDSDGNPVENAAGKNCVVESLGRVESYNDSANVYSCTLDTPFTETVDSYAPIYFTITYSGSKDAENTPIPIKKSLSSDQVTILKDSKEVWLEAKNDTPQSLTYTTSANNPTVSADNRRIYLAKPVSMNSDTNWTNIRIYYWDDVNGTNNGWDGESLATDHLDCLGNDTDYYYYYVDIPKKDNEGHEFNNIIFQGCGNGQTWSYKAKTADITKVPSSANYYVLSSNYTATRGENVIIPSCTRYKSAVAMNVGVYDEQGKDSIVSVALTNTPGQVNYTAKNVTYTSDNTDVVTVDQTGKIMPVSSGEAHITIKVYGTIGALLNNNLDCVTLPVTITIKDPSKFDSFEIMSLQSAEYTVNIPKAQNMEQTAEYQPAYFDMTGVVMTVTGIKGVASSTNSAIVVVPDLVNPGPDEAVLVGDKYYPTTFTVKYAIPMNEHGFDGYSGIKVTGSVVTKTIAREGSRFGISSTTPWKCYTNSQGDTGTTVDPSPDVSKVIKDSVETATTESIVFNSTYVKYSAIFQEYQYVDVTFVYDYFEYNPKVKDGMIEYPYDPVYAGPEDRNDDGFNKGDYANTHNNVTYTVEKYEVRGINTSTIAENEDLVDAAITALGVGPDNNYYDYHITVDTLDLVANSINTQTFTATVNVHMTHSVKTYNVYLNGEPKERTPNPDDSNDKRKAYYYQEYVELTAPQDHNLWYAVDDRTTTNVSNSPLLATGSSYKFRVKGTSVNRDTYLRTAQGSAPDDDHFNRSEVDFSHYETVHQGETLKEYLLQNFYIADFFSPEKFLDQSRPKDGGGYLPYDDVKFVGGGVVYYSVDEQGNPRSNNAVGLGYVNSDGTLNQDAVKGMLKSEILSSVNEDNYGKYSVEENGQTVQKSVSYESLENAIGTEDALKVAYGTEIAAHQYVENNIKTGVLYRYLPLETFSKDSDNWSNGVPVKDEKGNYYTTLNNNTFRYSNTLQSYQYVYASGNENKETNNGRNMRLYSYYVYSYVAYNQETNVPETKYEIVLSDNYSDASTYWNGK